MIMDGQEMQWEESSDEEDLLQKEEYYTYGLEELRDARRFILEYSIQQ